MAATITITRGVSLPNSASKTDFHNLIDTATGVLSGTITTSDISASAGIVGTQLSASANIADTQLAQITTASKVHGSSLTGLASTPSGAGVIPIANLATGTPDGTKYVRDDGTLVAPSVAAVAGMVVQSVSVSSAAVDTATTLLPVDNTTPSNSEGKELSALDVTLTPSSSSNILEFELILYAIHSSGDKVGATILQGTSVICAGYAQNSASFLESRIHIIFRKTAGTTSSTTWHVRYGPSTGGTAYVNSLDGANSLFNGLMYSTLIVKEIKA